MRVICLIIFFVSQLSYSQTKLGESLITIQTDKKNTDNITIEIYSYKFINHVYTGKELIVSVPAKKNGKDYLRFDLGKNTIYQNRYLISDNGPIIDLKEKKVIHDGFAKFVKCNQDSVIYFINDVFSGPYYSCFNLNSHKYFDIKIKGYKPELGEVLEFDQQKSPFKLYITPKGKTRELLLEDAGKGSVSGSTSKFEIPVYWIDNETFLFPKMKISEIEGELIKVHWPSKTTKSIGVFNSASNTRIKFSFTKSLNNFVEYNFKDKYFLLNPQKETMLMLFYKDFENNFSVSVEAKPQRLVYLKSVEIGKGNFAIENFSVSENHAAYLAVNSVGSNNSKSQLFVYSVFKGKWEVVNSENINSIVGWIKQ